MKTRSELFSEIKENDKLFIKSIESKIKYALSSGDDRLSIDISQTQFDRIKNEILNSGFRVTFFEASGVMKCVHLSRMVIHL